MASTTTTDKPRLSYLQEEDDYEIIVDENTGERFGLVQIQGSKKKIPLDRPVRVYADGIYDCFHYGHARSLEQAKKLFYNCNLIVGVCGDEITHKLKGKTVMTESERYECVRHCKWADEVVEDAPWVIGVPHLEKYGIDFVSHGEDLSVDEFGNDVYQGIKDLNRFLVIKRTEGISTSDLVMRIVKDYDKYVRRNLKRGYSRKDLGLGFFKEKQILIEAKFEDWRKNADKLMKNFIKGTRHTPAHQRDDALSPTDDVHESVEVSSPLPSFTFIVATFGLLTLAKIFK